MKVTVSMPKNVTSIVVISKNNPESAGIMLRSNTIGINDQGFMAEEKRVAWFKGRTEQIESFVKQYGLKDGSIFPIPVKLVVKESTTPFYNNQEPKVNPSTGEVINHNGSPVYRQTIVVAESSSEVDVKLASDKEQVQTPQATFATLEEQIKG